MKRMTARRKFWNGVLGFRRALSNVGAKRSGEAGIIVAAVLLVVAIILLLTFRTAIIGWLDSLINFFKTKITTFTS